MLSGPVAIVLATMFLITSALLSSGPLWQRRMAICSAISAAGIPWLVAAEGPFLRGGLAIWTTWCLGRVVDVVTESRTRSWGARLWHVFGVVDTRQATFTPPALDHNALGKTLCYAALATLGVLIVSEVATARDGTWYWVLRWFGGALFFYSLADAVEGAVRLLYRAAGVRVPRQHVLPIVSRSVQEFWGKRWNRAVGGWLRAHCFVPLARRGQVRFGLTAAFTASAIFHAYFTWVAVGEVMALAMAIFFLLQGGFVLLELRMGVARWHPVLAHAWTVSAVLGCSPLFVEPILRILVEGLS
ncbi:MAG: hypothetical protein FJ147_23405 [Deltaproteobacteria bacterium]|nr:hypothetical protein [Deltaproteobacteria bacterium]